MADKKEKSDWPAILFVLVGLPIAFTFGGVWVGLGILVVGVVALGWRRRHEGPFPTNKNELPNNGLQGTLRFAAPLSPSVRIRRDDMANLIHIYHNNQQEGPYSPEQLRDMMANGTVTPVTLAWKEGMSDWAPLETIMSPSQSTTAPAAPPPPPFADASSQASVASTPVATTGPKGVGGWLVFFCVGLTILGPLFSLGQISMNWEQAQPAFDQFPTLKTAVMWENAGSIALLVYGFFVGCMIWSGNPNGRNIAKRFLLIRFFGFIGIEFVTVVIMGDMPSQVVTSVIGTAIGAVFREGIWFLIWWLYFKKSKRVRNTYGTI